MPSDTMPRPAWLDPAVGDEQAGRLWCKAHGKRPKERREAGGWWEWDQDWSSGSVLLEGLPHPIWRVLQGKAYATEAAAYAAVGAAIRRLAAVVLDTRSDT